MDKDGKNWLPLPYWSLVTEFIWSITKWINQRNRLKLVCSTKKKKLIFKSGNYGVIMNKRDSFGIKSMWL